MVNDLNTITVEPGRRGFASLAAAQAAVPGLKVPTSLPQQAQFVQAVFWYPPKIDWRETNGRIEAANIDYNVAPSLDQGHVVVTFSVPGGSLNIDQGRFAGFANPRSGQLGPAATRRLPRGRMASVRDLRGSQFPQGRLRVVSWLEEPTGNAFAATSDVLTVDELVTIVDSV